jgi:hypothetical protein
MKQKIEQETNLTLLGQVLIEMGECNQALKYSEQMMHKAFDSTTKFPAKLSGHL